MNTGLRAGATIITVPGFEPGQFLDLLERYAVTRGHVVPPMALALARHPPLSGRDLSALRHITRAAPLGAELEEELARRMGCAVSQVYGLTEASLITHMAPPFGRAGKRGWSARRSRAPNAAWPTPKPAPTPAPGNAAKCGCAAPGDAGLPQQPRGDRGGDRPGGLAAHRGPRHRR